MLARSTRMFHRASGVSLSTPLLVPSFSSKGFSPVKGESEVGKIIETVSEWIESTFLISAYDIGKGHITAPERLPRPEIIILDSGGYEISDDHDLSAVQQEGLVDRKWTVENLIEVHDRWPEEQPAIFVSYDSPERPKTFFEQVADARALFKGRSSQLLTLLLKPHAKDASVENVLRTAQAHVDELGSFDVIGVTEKNLGNRMIDRIMRIASLRRAMDDAEIKAPIHVFGSLDPLSSCVYFLAGAEIFDGLTWLRYAYDKGRCVYLHNYGVLRHGLKHSDYTVRAKIWTDNYYELAKLEQTMKLVCSSGDISKLPNHVQLQEVVAILESKFGTKKARL